MEILSRAVAAAGLGNLESVRQVLARLSRLKRKEKAWEPAGPDAEYEDVSSAIAVYERALIHRSFGVSSGEKKSSGTASEKDRLSRRPAA